MSNGQMTRLRGIIFDMDGTLGDTLDICVEGLRRASEPLAGRSYTPADIWATFGPSEEGSVLVLAPNAPQQCLDDYIRHYEELHASTTEPFPGMRELLSDLRFAGVKLGLVTGKGPRTLEVSLRVMGLTDAFDEVKWGCPERPCKPERIHEIVEEWGFTGDEVGYVGDVPSDVRSAREAGVLALSAAWAPQAKADELMVAQPDALFRKVDELRVWLTASP